MGYEKKEHLRLVSSAEGAEYSGVDGSDIVRGLSDLCGGGIGGLEGFWVWAWGRGILDV